MSKNLTIRIALLLAILLVCTVALSAETQSRFLSGKVLDNGDRAIPKAIVYLKNTKTLVIKTYIADPDGSYHFPGLSPNIDYEVYAEHEGKHSDKKTVSSFDTRNRVNIILRIDR